MSNSRDLRPNPDLDQLWEDTGERLKKLGEAADSATDALKKPVELRKNDLLDEAFGVTSTEVKDLGNKAATASPALEDLAAASQSVKKNFEDIFSAPPSGSGPSKPPGSGGGLAGDPDWESWKKKRENGIFDQPPPPPPGGFTGGSGGGPSLPPGAMTGAGGMAEGGGALAAAGAVASSALTAFAVATVGPIAGLGALTAMIGGFVQAINPGIMNQLNMVMRDLTAVIGTALQPLMQAIVPMIRQFADILLPIARQLKEVFDRVANALMPIGAAFTQFVGMLLGSLMPVIDAVAEVFQMMSPVVEAFYQVMGVLMVALRPLIAVITSTLLPIFSLMADGLQVMIGALMGFAKTMVLIGARLAMIFGATGLVRSMMEAFQPDKNKADSTGLAAAQNPAYRSIENLGKDMALQAAIATGGGMKDKTEKDLFQDMVDELRDIKNGAGPTLVDLLLSMPRRIAEESVKYAKEKAGEAGDWAAPLFDPKVYGFMFQDLIFGQGRRQ